METYLWLLLLLCVGTADWYRPFDRLQKLVVTTPDAASPDVHLISLVSAAPNTQRGLRKKQSVPHLSSLFSLQAVLSTPSSEGEARAEKLLTFRRTVDDLNQQYREAEKDVRPRKKARVGPFLRSVSSTMLQPFKQDRHELRALEELEKTLALDHEPTMHGLQREAPVATLLQKMYGLRPSIDRGHHQLPLYQDVLSRQPSHEVLNTIALGSLAYGIDTPTAKGSSLSRSASTYFTPGTPRRRPSTLFPTIVGSETRSTRRGSVSSMDLLQQFSKSAPRMERRASINSVDLLNDPVVQAEAYARANAENAAEERRRGKGKMTTPAFPVQRLPYLPFLIGEERDLHVAQCRAEVEEPLTTLQWEVNQVIHRFRLRDMPFWSDDVPNCLVNEKMEYAGPRREASGVDDPTLVQQMKDERAIEMTHVAIHRIMLTVVSTRQMLDIPIRTGLKPEVEQLDRTLRALYVSPLHDWLLRCHLLQKSTERLQIALHLASHWLLTLYALLSDELRRLYRDPSRWHTVMRHLGQQRALRGEKLSVQNRIALHRQMKQLENRRAKAEVNVVPYENTLGTQQLRLRDFTESAFHLLPDMVTFFSHLAMPFQMVALPNKESDALSEVLYDYLNLYETVPRPSYYPAYTAENDHPKELDALHDAIAALHL